LSHTPDTAQHEAERAAEDAARKARELHDKITGIRPGDLRWLAIAQTRGWGG
jgi:hypothetical protein